MKYQEALEEVKATLVSIENDGRNYVSEYLSKETLIVCMNALDIINRQQAEIERLKGYPYAIQVEVSKKLESQIKSKAAKECLAKVKNYIKTHCNPYGKPDFEYDTSIKILNFIDNLVKEMVGEENDR